MLFAAVYLLLFRAILGSHYKGQGDLVWFLQLKLFILLLLTGYLGYILADGATSYWSLHNACPGRRPARWFPRRHRRLDFRRPGRPRHAGQDGGIPRRPGAAAVHRHLRADRRPAHRRHPRIGAGRWPSTPIIPASTSPAFVIFALIFAILVFFAPHLGENHLNAAAANPLLVPTVLTPPWYLRPIAAIGSVVPTTLGSIIAVIAGLAVLYALPWLDRSKPGAATGFLYKLLVFVLALDVIALAIASAAPPSFVTGILVKIFIIWYFLHFLVLTPLTSATLSSAAEAK